MFEKELLIPLCFFILSNIMTTIYVVFVGSKISVQQKYISTVFDEIIKHYSKNGGSNGR